MEEKRRSDWGREGINAEDVNAAALGQYPSPWEKVLKMSMIVNSDVTCELSCSMRVKGVEVGEWGNWSSGMRGGRFWGVFEGVFKNDFHNPDYNSAVHTIQKDIPLIIHHQFLTLNYFFLFNHTLLCPSPFAQAIFWRMCVCRNAVCRDVGLFHAFTQNSVIGNTVRDGLTARVYPTWTFLEGRWDKFVLRMTPCLVPPPFASTPESLLRSSLQQGPALFFSRTKTGPRGGGASSLNLLISKLNLLIIP